MKSTVIHTWKLASINKDNCKREPLIPEPEKRMTIQAIQATGAKPSLYQRHDYSNIGLMVLCLNLFVVKFWYTRPLHWWHQLLKLTNNMNHLELLSSLIFHTHKINITIIVSIHYSAALTYCFFNLSFLKSQEVIHLSNNAFIKEIHEVERNVEFILTSTPRILAS